MFNKIVIFAVVALTTVLAPLEASANPPANNNVVGAIAITGEGSIAGTNVEATKQANEPSHALDRGGSSVWYKYTATVAGVIKFTIDSAELDSLLAVYKGTSFSNMRLIAANDDFSEDNGSVMTSLVRVGAKPGDVFLIAVDGAYKGNVLGADTGTFTLNYHPESSADNDNFANAIKLFSLFGRLRTTSNVNATKEPGEPNHVSNSGGRSVWYEWKPQASYTFRFTLSSANVDTTGGVQSLFAIYAGTSLGNLTEVARGGHGTYSEIVFKATAGQQYYIAIDGKDNGTGPDTGTFMLTFGLHVTDKNPDVDNDGTADITVYRPSTGTWYTRESITEQVTSRQWGTNGDRPLLADKTRDGKPDYSVFRPSSGTWYVDRSDDIDFETFNWGLGTDIPLIRRRHSLAGLNDAGETVFRPSTGTWYSNFGAIQVSYQWGQAGDIPVLADFTGDGTDDLTVFRPSTGVWYIVEKQVPLEYKSVQFGMNGDRPAVADFDRDGKADIGVFRPSTGTWYVITSKDGGYETMQFGLAEDIPQPADYDGDQIADYAVFRPSTGDWYIRSSREFVVKTVHFGATGDIPVSAPIY